MNATLTARTAGKVVFTSAAKWLHPIFELEVFLCSAEAAAQGVSAATLDVEDKIVGRAAALLLVNLGVGSVQARLLSEHGREVLEAHAVRYGYDELVARIDCSTETLLMGVNDPADAHRLLQARAQRARGGNPPPVA